MRDFVEISDLQKDGAPFADPNFKLAVIDALMFNDTLDLGNVRQFQARLTNGRYDYGKDGYVLNQAFLSYFRQYPLTQAHLDQVDALTFDGGLDIYAWIFPFWGGETQDFDISGLRDIALLPNLKAFTFSAMLQSNDLGPLGTAPKLEKIGLGAVDDPWRNWEALLSLTNLKSLRYFNSNDTPEAKSVLDELRLRGVTITAF